MPYSSFTTIGKVKEAFNLTTVEAVRFLPEIDPIAPSQALTAFLEESLPFASSASEKARNDIIINFTRHTIIAIVANYVRHRDYS